MQTVQEKVLGLDLENLTEEELAWIHELKNRAAVMTGRLQLKYAETLDKESGE